MAEGRLTAAEIDLYGRFKTLSGFNSHSVTAAKLKYLLCHLHGKWYETLRFISPFAVLPIGLLFYCNDSKFPSSTHT